MIEKFLKNVDFMTFIYTAKPPCNQKMSDTSTDIWSNKSVIKIKNYFSIIQLFLFSTTNKTV